VGSYELKREGRKSSIEVEERSDEKAINKLSGGYGKRTA
jgi:hypothetical protein